MSQNINLAVCFDNHNYDCDKSILCSGGYKMDIIDEEKYKKDCCQNKCPECGTPILMIDTFPLDIKPGDNQELLIPDKTVKFVNFCSEDGKKIIVKDITYKNIKLSVDVKQSPDNELNYHINKIENYEATIKTIDIDLSRKPVAIITDD